MAYHTSDSARFGTLYFRVLGPLYMVLLWYCFSYFELFRTIDPLHKGNKLVIKNLMVEELSEATTHMMKNES